MECDVCQGSRIEMVYGGHGSVLELDCSKCTASAEDIIRLRRVETAAYRLAYVVRKSVNAGPLSKDPTSEGLAWKELREALGEWYDKDGNLVSIPSKAKGE